MTLDLVSMNTISVQHLGSKVAQKQLKGNPLPTEVTILWKYATFKTWVLNRNTYGKE